MDRKQWWKQYMFVLWLLGGVIGMGLVWSLVRQRHETTVEGDVTFAVAPLEIPTPPLSDYVGSATCAECHAEIATTYAKHPMANSFSAVDQATAVENFGAAEFTAADDRRYSVERTNSGHVFHHESRVDSQGTIYDRRFEIAFALGSGRHGRAYLVERKNLLFQSPITWYSQQSRWDLSPGYAPSQHPGFERRVDDGCLYCHVGRIETGSNSSDRPAKLSFFEAAIGCERCHGPGGRHVAYHRDEATILDAVDPIVNPNELSPAERDAVCFICHLQGRATFRRFGRGFFDYRPGQRLEDTLLIYLEGSRIDEQQTTLPVSQVEQMLASRCYRESAGKFTCTSCHDPHRLSVGADRITHFRNKCLACHSVLDCVAPATARRVAGVDDSCIACHMPALPTREVAHTALTDHRVIRRIQPNQELPPISDPNQLLMFGDEARLSERERDRGRGLLLMEAAQGLLYPRFAERAQSLLVPRKLSGAPLQFKLGALQNDPLVLDSIGMALHMTGQKTEAHEFWQAAVMFDPSTERSLHMLVQFYVAQGDTEAALFWLNRLADLNPLASEIQAQHAQLLWSKGQTAAAVEAACLGVELDPANTNLRELLERLYRQTDRIEAADKQKQLRQRLLQARTPTIPN